MTTNENRHQKVSQQLAWMDTRHIIHIYSRENARYKVVLVDRGPALSLTLKEAEIFVSGALTMHRWHELIRG